MQCTSNAPLCVPMGFEIGISRLQDELDIAVIKKSETLNVQRSSAIK